jgi:hypothetical protein
VPDELDTRISRALSLALDDVDLGPSDWAGIKDNAPNPGTLWRGRSAKLLTSGLIACVLATVAIVAGVFSGGSASGVYVRHVGQWTVRVETADAAVQPATAPRAVVAQGARETYLSLRQSYRNRGIYLSNKPTVDFLGRSAAAISVRFPSGTTLSVPDGPADVWYAEVSAAGDPQDPARQVDMVFGPTGKLLRAFPRNAPALLGNAGLTSSQINTLQWQDVPVTRTELPDDGCSGPACSTGTETDVPPPNPDATITIQKATTDDGGTAFAITGTHLNPSEPYFLDSSTGTVGSAESGSDGSLVAMITVDSATAQTIAQNVSGGLVAVHGAGFEMFRACPFGGSLDYGSSLVTCH